MNFFIVLGDEIEVQKFLLDKKRSTHKIEDDFTVKFARIVDRKWSYLPEILSIYLGVVLNSTISMPVPQILKLWVAKECPTYNDLRQKLHVVPLLSQ